MRLIADKILRGADLMADPGDEFESDAEAAAELIAANAAHPAPKVVERAVEVPAVEKAVDEPEVSQRVIPPEKPGAKPKPGKRVRKGRKVSGK